MQTHNDSDTTNIAIVGASGKLGSRVAALALDDTDARLVLAIDATSSPSLGKPAVAGRDDAPTLQTLESALKTRDRTPVDAVIDVSSDAGSRDALHLAEHADAALLVGTTGLSQETIDALRACAKQRALIIAPNMSMGVAVVAEIAQLLAERLPGFDCSLVEAHHNQKQDAPSGTALRLARAARDAGASLPDDQILSVRAGDIIGEHTLRFASQGEYIEITHHATTRDLFARGALRAAHWLKGRSPGEYTIEDVVRSS